jgi:hypothetical protein
MSKQMTDDTIKDVAMRTDKFIAEIVNELITDADGIHPLEIAAVVFSRLMVMARSIEMEDDLKRLCTIAMNIQEPKPIIQ